MDFVQIWLHSYQRQVKLIRCYLLLNEKNTFCVSFHYSTDFDAPSFLQNLILENVKRYEAEKLMITVSNIYFLIIADINQTTTPGVKLQQQLYDFQPQRLTMDLFRLSV